MRGWSFLSPHLLKMSCYTTWRIVNCTILCWLYRDCDPLISLFVLDSCHSTIRLFSPVCDRMHAHPKWPETGIKRPLTNSTVLSLVVTCRVGHGSEWVCVLRTTEQPQPTHSNVLLIKDLVLVPKVNANKIIQTTLQEISTYQTPPAPGHCNCSSQ